MRNIFRIIGMAIVVLVAAVFILSLIGSAVNEFPTVKVGEEIIVPISTPITNSIMNYGIMLMLMEQEETPLLINMHSDELVYFVEKDARLKALSVERISDDIKRHYFQSSMAKEIKNMVKIRVLDGENEGKEGWVSDLQFFMSR